MYRGPDGLLVILLSEVICGASNRNFALSRLMSGRLNNCQRSGKVGGANIVFILAWGLAVGAESAKLDVVAMVLGDAKKADTEV